MSLGTRLMTVRVLAYRTCALELIPSKVDFALQLCIACNISSSPGEEINFDRQSVLLSDVHRLCMLKYHGRNYRKSV